MSRAKIRIPLSDLVRQTSAQTWELYSTDVNKSDTEITLDVCADCVSMPTEVKEPRTVEDIRRDLQTAWDNQRGTSPHQWPTAMMALVIELVDIRVGELAKMFSPEQGHSEHVRCLSGLGYLQCVLNKGHSDQHMNGLHRW